MIILLQNAVFTQFGKNGQCSVILITDHGNIQEFFIKKDYFLDVFHNDYETKKRKSISCCYKTDYEQLFQIVIQKKR